MGCRADISRTSERERLPVKRHERVHVGLETLVQFAFARRPSVGVDLRVPADEHIYGRDAESFRREDAPPLQSGFEPVRAGVDLLLHLAEEPSLLQFVLVDVARGGTHVIELDHGYTHCDGRQHEDDMLALAAE